MFKSFSLYKYFTIVGLGLGLFGVPSLAMDSQLGNQISYNLTHMKQAAVSPLTSQEFIKAFTNSLLGGGRQPAAKKQINQDRKVMDLTKNAAVTKDGSRSSIKASPEIGTTTFDYFWERRWIFVSWLPLLAIFIFVLVRFYQANHH